MFLTHEIVITLTIKYVKKILHICQHCRNLHIINAIMAGRYHAKKRYLPANLPASVLAVYRKLLGFMSNSSLKHLLKYEGEVKPTSYAISETLFSVFSNS